MSTSSINATKFYEEVAQNKKVFTIRDDGGYPAPKNSEGKRAQPFWSSKLKAEKVIGTVPAYKDFRVEEITLEEFENKHLKELKDDDMLVGVNWSGDNATGYDLDPNTVLEAIKIRE